MTAPTARLAGLLLDQGPAPADDALRAAAERAARLGLPLLRAAEPEAFVLVQTRERLELRCGRRRPLHIDPRDPRLLRRASRHAARQELLRACGWRGAQPAPGIVDATAGLGLDGRLLALLGAHVVAFERHVVLAELLLDAARRWAEIDPQAAGRWSPLHADALEQLPRLPAPGPEIVLLDPMFDDAGRSAAPRGEVALLRRLVGPDTDAANLLDSARAVARRRVVVKRHLRDAPLAGPAPSLVVRGQSTRFDVYVRTDRA